MKYWTLIAFLFGLVLMFFIMRYFNKPETVYVPVNNDSLFKKVDSLQAVSQLWLLKFDESQSKIDKYKQNEARLRKVILEINEKYDTYNKSDIIRWLNAYESTNRYGVPFYTNDEIAD